MEQTNAATTKKRATPPSVSQLMAAKRAVKERNEAHQETSRQIAPTGYADRNLISSIRAEQARNRIALQKGAPESLDERLTDNIRNLMHLEVLVYGEDMVSTGVIEKTIRAHRVIASIYDDAELLDATRRAEQALNDLGHPPCGRRRTQPQPMPRHLVPGWSADWFRRRLRRNRPRRRRAAHRRVLLVRAGVDLHHCTL